MNLTTLQILQHDFVHAIFGKANESDAVRHVCGDDKLTAKERFGIYRGSVQGILTQALGDMYPVCKALVGEKFFTQMASVYINKCPPTSAYLADFGSEFTDFLQHYEPVNSVPYLPDIALFEFYRHLGWHTSNQSTSDFTQMALMDDDEQSRIIFRLAKTASLLHSNYAVDSIWEAHQDGSEQALESLVVDDRVRLIIWRQQNTMQHVRLNDGMWDFLNKVKDRATLEQLVDYSGENISDYLSSAVQSGWIISFS